MTSPTHGPPGDQPDGPSAVPVCPRHPGVVSYISCQRCGRPTCPDCQRPAAVGVQCVDCVREGGRTVPTPQTRFGAPVRADDRPLVTWTLLGLCVAVFLGQLANPASVTGTLAFRGVLAGSEPWRFVTSAFVHSPSSFLHILFNMYILYAFGPMLEQVMGRAKFLVTYLLCAVGGSVGVLLLAVPNPGWFVWVVGASGAIFGLLFLYVVLALRTGSVPGSLLLMIGINLALPFFVDGIAWQAHVGGAVTGAAIGGLLTLTSAPGRSEQAQRRRRLIWPALAGVAVLLAALAVWRILAVMGPGAFTLV
ncbi:rhomboid family intramembrane serine protease [Ornithinimicrobium sufpigmenti]|uniref:rhomboid family intramembrane serine protease n=1 Tax=Ornithinimicrobium sufpigmenti TaxID=2508882 RepID=UPI0010355D05|nr:MULTISPECIES: rhomboid family intramembrane serine protease [unclassified Ornithinimicrobium]